MDAHAFEAFRAADAPVRPGLPAFAYTDEAFRARENDTLFRDHWVFVAFAHGLGKPGDVRPLTVAGRPVLLVRGRDGDIRAFHNVCRHRCLELVEAPGNCGRLIRCPYHAWAYDLDGRLVAAPYFGGPDREPPAGFDLADHGLVPVPCRAWHDWVFVNLGGNAMAFEEFVAPLAARLDGLPLDALQPVATLDLGEVACNWKFLMENFIEPYHVQFVHATTTSQPLASHRTIVDGHCLGCACDIDETGGADTAATLAVSSVYLTLFPNFVLGTYAPDQVGVHLNLPAGVGRTRQHRVIYVHRDRVPAPDEVEQLRTLWTEVHREDHAICERLQLGRQSEVAAAGGYLSPHWEDSVRRFQELVVDATFAPHA